MASETAPPLRKVETPNAGGGGGGGKRKKKKGIRAKGGRGKGNPTKSKKR